MNTPLAGTSKIITQDNRNIVPVSKREERAEMPVTATSTALETIITAIKADTGLKAKASAADIAAGIAAARKLNDVLGQAIEHFNFNDDKLITAAELKKISDYVRATPLLDYDFIIGHGNDEGNVETGFHKVQNDGGTMLFQGRNMIDTVIDAIYHYGETYSGSRFVNEDGNQNEKVSDVAGWLNYFLNGTTQVFGTSGNDMLGSGEYSAAIAAAANETFRAGAGNDKIWGHTGRDTIYAGTGNDEAGGGSSGDVIWGEDGADKLYGDSGNDTLYGGNGADRIGGGTGNDKLDGGADNDILYGEAGNDKIQGGDGDDEIGGGDGLNTLNGDAGRDQIHGGNSSDVIDGGTSSDKLYGNAGRDKIFGGDGNDAMYGGDGSDSLRGQAGNDKLYAGEGADWLRGGLGADTFYLWDNNASSDRIYFSIGESGRTAGTIDIVEGFTSGEDKIDLSSMGDMSFEKIDFSGDGASCFYDGTYLRIDTDGDRATDMMIKFMWVDSLAASDLLLA
jgi:Ca2+-binding RTX toxin-like protein